MNKRCYWLLLALVPSCGERAPALPARTTLSPAAPAASVVASPASSAPARVDTPPTTAPTPTTAPPADDAKAPEPPGSTLGSIACGATRCAAGKQLCSFQQDWTCVDAATKPESSALYCDDTSDCQAGLACCLTGASAERVQLCTKRKGPDSACAVELCKPGGASCPKGEHCDDEACVANRHVNCPPNATCTQDQLCQWQAEQASCVSNPLEVDSIDEPRGVFACTRPADCGPGHECCTSMSVNWRTTYCAMNCDVTNTMTICSTPRDCRRKLELLPKDRRHQAKLACAPVGDGGPPWLKACRLDLPEDF